MVCAGVGTVLLFPLLAAIVHTNLPGPEEEKQDPVKQRAREQEALQEAKEYRQQMAKKSTNFKGSDNTSVVVKKKPISTTVQEHEITLDEDEHHDQ